VRGHERHAVRGVGVEVDAREQAERVARAILGGVLVALVEEVGAVVVGRVGAGHALLEDEVGVLVGLGLDRLRRARRRRQHLREQRVVGGRDVVLVAVVRHDALRVLELRGALRDDDLGELGRQAARGRVAGGALVGGRDVAELRAGLRARGADRGEERSPGDGHRAGLQHPALQLA
jgi:hypothetical protein